MRVSTWWCRQLQQLLLQKLQCMLLCLFSSKLYVFYFFFTLKVYEWLASTMDIKWVPFALICLLFFESAVHICDSSGEPVADTRDQLLALHSTVRLTSERPHVHHKLRKRRRRGCTWREDHNRWRCYRPVFPSVITGNLGSIRHKMDELMVLTHQQMEYRRYSTWLNDFQLIQAERMK